MELNGIVTDLELLVILFEIKELRFKLKSIMLVLNSLVVVMSLGSLISLSIGVVRVGFPESSEFNLFFGLDIKRDFFALEYLSHLNVYHTSERVSRLIETLIELKTDRSAWEFSLWITIDLLLSFEEIFIIFVGHLNVDLVSWLSSHLIFVGIGTAHR